MSDVKWIKLSVNICDDEKIRLIDSLPEKDAIFVIWIKLLCLAGKCNEDGAIYLAENIPYTDEMLSTIFNRPVSIIRLALETFERMGMLSINEQVIYIENFTKHQNQEGLERIREQTRLRVAKLRERRLEKNRKEKTRLDKSSNAVTETLRNVTTTKTWLKDGFLKLNNGSFANYPKEASAIKALTTKAANQANGEDAQTFLRLMVGAYIWKKKNSKQDFWKDAPLTPSGLNCRWDQVYEVARSKHEEAAIRQEAKEWLAMASG